MSRARAGEVDEHPDHRDAGQDRDRDWRPRGRARRRCPCFARDGSRTGRRGRRTRAARARERTMPFVTWSAAMQARATTASDSHWARPAASDRVATDTGTRPSVAEPTRTSVKGGRSLSLAPPAACSRCTSSRRASPRGAPRDGVPAALARAERSVLDPAQSALDLVEHARRVLLERVVELSVERHRGGVRVAGLRHLVVLGAGVLRVEVRDRVTDTPSLVQKELAEALVVHPFPFRRRAERRRSASSCVMPSISTSLSLEPCPVTSRSLAGRTPRVAARNPSSSWFALPRSARAATRTFHPSP